MLSSGNYFLDFSAFQTFGSVLLNYSWKIKDSNNSLVGLHSDRLFSLRREKAATWESNLKVA